MELALIEFELNVEAFFDADLHLNGLVHLWLLACIAHDEFLFLGDSIIRPIDDHEYVVAQLDHNAVVALELLLHAVELKVVRDVVSERTWRL